MQLVKPDEALFVAVSQQNSAIAEFEGTAKLKLSWN